MQVKFLVRYNHHYTLTDIRVKELGGSILKAEKREKNAGGHERYLTIQLPNNPETMAWADAQKALWPLFEMTL